MEQDNILCQFIHLDGENMNSLKRLQKFPTLSKVASCSRYLVPFKRRLLASFLMVLIPCGTKFLRVLIFVIFPAIRKNKNYRKQIFLTYIRYTIIQY